MLTYGEFVQHFTNFHGIETLHKSGLRDRISTVSGECNQDLVQILSRERNVKNRSMEVIAARL